MQLSIESQGAWGKVSKCRWRRQELDATLQCGRHYKTVHCTVQFYNFCAPGHAYIEMYMKRGEYV